MNGPYPTGLSSHFAELTSEECRERLAARTTGRVGWTDADESYILPVTYVLYTEQVVFRTSPYGVLSRLRRRTRVAFEVDEIDEATGHGWSVLVQGFASAVMLPGDLARLWATPGMVPWAPGTRNVFIGITTSTLSGRVVRAPFAD